MLQFRWIDLLVFSTQVKTGQDQIALRNFLLFCQQCLRADLVYLKRMEESGESQIILKLDQTELIEHFLQFLWLLLLFLSTANILFLPDDVGERVTPALPHRTLLFLSLDIFPCSSLLPLLVLHFIQSFDFRHANVNIIQPGFDGIVKLA